MSESNVKLEKIKKSSKSVLVAINVIRIICMACAITALVAGIGIWMMQDTVNESFRVTEFSEETLLSFAEMGITADLLTGQSQNVAIVLGTYIFTMGVILFVMTVILHFVGKVFKEFCESYSPFTSRIIRNLRITLVLLTVFVLKSSLGIGIVMALASWCILCIFEYGCELQKESDETL